MALYADCILVKRPIAHIFRIPSGWHAILYAHIVEHDFTMKKKITTANFSLVLYTHYTYTVQTRVSPIYIYLLP